MENFDLKEVVYNTGSRLLEERMQAFREWAASIHLDDSSPLRRVVGSCVGPDIEIVDKVTGKKRPLTLFGSNSYLALAHHPYVLNAVHSALDQWGLGAGGPPLLNGTTVLHEQLEQRLAKKTGHEDCLLFPSGFQAQIGWVGALVGRDDIVFHDEGCHASFYDGIKTTHAKSISFRHNDVQDLLEKLNRHALGDRTCWISVEGVYSMDGDLAPLPDIVCLAEQYGCRVVVDDAHGSGIIGVDGAGTPSELGVAPTSIFLHMGTFSKTFSMTGGYVCGDHDTISFLRYMARPHIFSAALPTATIAGVHACLDVLVQEPDRIARLHENVRMLVSELRRHGIDTQSQSGIVPIRLKPGLHAFPLCSQLERRGFFVNGVIYPAVPRNQERLRISMMSEHAHHHISKLVTAIVEELSPSLQS